jgi:hypothetical protein
MKKQILMFALMLVTVASYSFTGASANDNKRAVISFKKEFSNAREIKWETIKTFLKVTFILNEEQFEAFYDQDGASVALSRKISPSQLPTSLLINLHKKYEDGLQKQLIEMVRDNETYYYISLDYPGYSLILEGYDGVWTVFKKTKK